MDDSISCFKINFDFLGRYGKNVVKEVFRSEFPVWIIPFPDLKINFGLLDKNKKYFVNSKHIQADSVYIAYIYDPSRSNHIQLEPHRAKQIQADSVYVVNI